MSYGRKPAHRSGERVFNNYMERYPDSLRQAYTQIHDSIKADGQRRVEWYHLKQGETRYRTKDRSGQYRGKVFAGIKIYDAWLVVSIPEHDPGFRKKYAKLLRNVPYERYENYWYGKGQYSIALDVGSNDFRKELSWTLRLLRAALSSAQ